MALNLTDTLRRATVPFEPREAGKASLYVCGPTVQSEAHVGHGRVGVVFDVLNRWLRHSGYDVTLVLNITDIDDKIILRAQREGVPTAVIAERYARVWNRAMDALGVLPPDVQPRATGHVPEMLALIGELVDRGFAYESDGSVLFRVRKFDAYGQLSKRRTDDAQQGDDVPEDTKEDAVDFALWKAAKPGEPFWDSPWGPGRPGWHIECSAMAVQHLGGGFDIHGGGVDLVFPHHENEIAQYEAVHGAPFARYWLHNGMVELGSEKMSKSVGNVIGLLDAVQRWGPGPLRHWYASATYRSPLSFDAERLDESAAAHGRLVTFLRAARVASAGAAPDADAVAATRDAFAAAMDDDLNTSGALAALFDLAGAGNERLRLADDGDAEARAMLAAAADVLVELGDGVLGLHLEATLEQASRLEVRLAPLVDDLLAQREAARAARDFAAADAIRDRLAAVGVVVEDRPGGARWYVEV